MSETEFYFQYSVMWALKIQYKMMSHNSIVALLQCANDFILLRASSLAYLQIRDKTLGSILLAVLNIQYILFAIDLIDNSLKQVIIYNKCQIRALLVLKSA